jgi:hypothetical protein
MNVETGTEAALFLEKEYILYMRFSLQCVKLAGFHMQKKIVLSVEIR